MDISQSAMFTTMKVLMSLHLMDHLAVAKFQC